jgi:hypothetical protein
MHHFLLVLVALEVASPKKSEKVAQHEPTGQKEVPLQATKEAYRVLKALTLNVWLQNQMF